MPARLCAEGRAERAGRRLPIWERTLSDLHLGAVRVIRSPKFGVWMHASIHTQAPHAHTGIHPATTATTGTNGACVSNLKYVLNASIDLLCSYRKRCLASGVTSRTVAITDRRHSHGAQPGPTELCPQRRVRVLTREPFLFVKFSLRLNLVFLFGPTRRRSHNLVVVWRRWHLPGS